jgi:predicted nucleic acid-binding protein
VDLVSILDSGPLGLVTKPRGKPDREAARKRLDALVAAGWAIVVPEIADYEVRRELVRAGARAGLKRLDDFNEGAVYLPITTEVMRVAAELWAYVRNTGQSTADDKALDGDCIVAAFALVESHAGARVCIVTENPRHLSRFPGVQALSWNEVDAMMEHGGKLFTIRFIGGPFDGQNLQSDDADGAKAHAAQEFYLIAKQGEVGTQFMGLSRPLVEALMTSDGTILGPFLSRTRHVYRVVSSRWIGERNLIEIQYQELP